MDKLTIPYENLRQYAYCNAGLLSGTPSGVVLDFTGLNGCKMFDEDTEKGRMYAAKNILYLFPYINPWAWMNRDAVRLADAVTEAVFAHFHLPDGTPLISTGGSMGGQCALTWCYYAARTPSACAVICPACNLVYHYSERPDVARTLLSAFGGYDMPLMDAIASASPLCLADKMPRIPYYVVHCEQDLAVSKEMHSDKLVAALRPAHEVTYSSVPGRGHCDLTDEARAEYHAFIISHCGQE